jgi:hypothetical protein
MNRECEMKHPTEVEGAGSDADCEASEMEPEFARRRVRRHQ